MESSSGGGDPIQDFERISRIFGAGSNVANTNVLHAGGIGLWIAVWVSTLCCAVMLFNSWNAREEQIRQSIADAEMQRHIDNANDKLSIILQWAPHLAKEVDDEMKRRQEKKP